MPDDRATDARATTPAQRGAPGAPGRAERGLPEAAAPAAKGRAAKQASPAARERQRPSAAAMVYYESAPAKPTEEELKDARSARTIAEVYARQVLGIKGGIDTAVQGVRSWKEFHAHFERFASIKRVVFMLHGGAGAMQVGDHTKELSVIAAAFGKHAPHVDEIDFEACNIANDAPQMVSFGRRLQATKVRGWNMYWVPRVMTVDVGDRRDITKLTVRTAPFRPWLLENSPTDAQMFKRGGRWKLVTEWFRPDASNVALPGAPGPGRIDGRRMTFRPRSSAVDVTITAADAATYSDRLGNQLTHVTVDLSEPAKTPPAAAPSPRGAPDAR